jgi:ribosomal protein L32
MQSSQSDSTIAGESSDGSNSSKRRSYTLKEKKAIIAKVECRLKSGEVKTAHKACKDLGVDHRYYGRWKKSVETQQQLKASQAYIPYNISYTSRKLHQGRKSDLDSISGQLERYIFELREQGLQVTTQAVKIEASRLSTAFRSKTDAAKK